MAVVHVETLDLPSPRGVIRARLARPRQPRGPLPVVIAYPDIFQLTPPHERLLVRLAGHGFAVLAPELYGRLLPPGTSLDFEQDRQLALDSAAQLRVDWLDEDRQATLAAAAALPGVDGGRLGVCGWCFGGHLAFRAALDPRVRATACFYATGVHSGDLGAAKGTAGTLERAGEIQGELLLVWGRNDPHIPAEGRSAIHRALERAGTRHEVRYHDAEHAFMRDVGPRFDPEATDRAFSSMLDLFARTL
jgi:carboxymethylenebutenolidase